MDKKYKQRPLDDLFSQHGLHLNISAKNYPADKLEKFLLRYQDLILVRLMESEKKLINPFGSSAVNYQPNDIRSRGLLRFSDPTKRHFEIRAQALSPKKTLDEIFFHMSEIIKDEEKAFSELDKKIVDKIDAKFFKKILNPMGLESELKAAGNNTELIRDIKNKFKLQVTAQQNALDSILKRYYPDKMKLIKLHEKLLADTLSPETRRKKWIELADMDNFSMEKFLQKYDDFLDTYIDKFFSDIPTVRKYHEGPIEDGLNSLSKDEQIKLLEELRSTNTDFRRLIMYRMREHNKFHPDFVNKIIEIAKHDIKNGTEYVKILINANLSPAEQLSLSKLLLNDIITEYDKPIVENILEILKNQPIQMLL